jgi:hypothetical protein
VDFDLSLVEDPVDVLIEHTASDHCQLSRRQAESVLGWMARNDRISEAHHGRLAVRLLEWISGAHVTRKRMDGNGRVVCSHALGDMRLGIRAAVAIRELIPKSKISGMTQHDLAHSFGVRQQTLFAVIKSFRKYFRK